MSHFFPMGRKDGWYLAALLVFSVVSFFPPWREIRFAGMAVFGWLMAALMVLSPTLALAVFFSKKRRPQHGPKGAS